MHYTEDQEKVVYTRNADILVAAAAGSGKTQTLTGRILAKITDEKNPVDIDKLLIVTFTKAAAAEMRERIGQQIKEALQKDPFNEHLLKQEMLLHNAHICTIDSFCAFLVKNHFTAIGLDPVYRIADTGERGLIQEGVVDRLLEEHYQRLQENPESEEGFRLLVECYEHTGKGRILANMIIEAAEYAEGLAEPLGYIKACKAMYAEEGIANFEESAWWKLFLQSADHEMENNLKRMQRALRLMDENPTLTNYRQVCEEHVGACNAFLQAKTYKEKRDALPTSFSKAGSARNQSGIITDEIKALRESVKSSMIALLSKQFVAEPEALKNELLESAVYTRAFIELVEEFMTLFAQEKREKRLVDFGDIEHFAYDILTTQQEDGSREPSTIALEYREAFEEIMVDEYQDSSYLQEALLSTLIGPDGKNHYFMVGDVKQSIYRFRNARPDIFIGKYNTFGDAGEKIRIDLNKNFRSRKEVLSFANQIFEIIMFKNLGGIEYDEKARLDAQADYKEGQREESEEDNKTEVLLVNMPASETAERTYGEEEEEDTDRLEERLVAARIKQMFRNGFLVKDKKTEVMRPVQYKDIVILVRSVKGCAEDFRKVFEKEGIPLSYEAKTGFFHTREIREMVNLMKVIDNPSQDIALYGVLTSYFGKFTEEEVAAMKATEKQKIAEEDAGKRRKKSLYLILQEEASHNHKAKAFIEQIEHYRDMAEYQPIRALLEYVLRTTGYLEYMTAFPGGVQRRANLTVLLERAEEFEKTSFHGLFHFCRFLERLKEREEDMGEAGIATDDMNAVRLMTIHHSKGLEFPVCFISKIFKKFNNGDVKGQALCDPVLGIGMDYYEPDTRTKHAGILKSMISAAIKKEAQAENIRTLYVAMTRAREKMIFTGVASGKKGKTGQDKIREQYFNKTVDEQDVVEANSFGDLLMLGIRGSAIHEKYLGDTAFYSPEDIQSLEISEEAKRIIEKEMLPKEAVEEDFVETIKKQLTFIYPHQNISNLYTKTTVTELKKKAFEEENEVHMFVEADPEETRTRPRFIESEESGKKEVQGTNRGTAYHRMMELTDFAALPTEGLSEFYESQKKKAVDSEKISRDDAELVSVTKAVQFYESALARRMSEAAKQGKLYKEQPFFMGISAAEVEAAFPEEEIITVQGVIDVYFEEEDGLVLMDYKTDRVTTGDELIKRYKTQLEYYQRALMNATGKPVKERLIYSFALGETIKV